MKKDSYYYTLKGILLLGLFLFSLNVSAQKIRYVSTKHVDQNGVQKTFGIDERGVWFINYQNDNTLALTPAVSDSYPLLYGFHHKDGDNYVYYQIATEIINGSKSFNEDGVIVVSPDGSLVNWISYRQGHRQSTIVLERRDPDTYGAMVR